MHSEADIKKFCEINGKKKLLLDTNLFCLLIIGICMRGKVSECNLTSSYNEDSWELLNSLIKRYFKGIYITPHILAEVSNLAKNKLDTNQHKFYFQHLIERLLQVKEHGVPLDSFKDIQCYLLSQYGYTDIGIVKAAKDIDAVIMTADAGLFQYTVTNGHPAINFASVRTHGVIIT